MIPTKTLTALAMLDLTPEQAEAVATMLRDVEEATAAQIGRDIKTRRENDRLRKGRQRHGTSRDVTGQSGFSGDNWDSPSPPKNVPLEPPKNTPRFPEADASGGEAAISDDPSEAERQLFVRGKRVLGGNAGGQIAKLKAHFGGNVALARAAIETASTKHDARQYVGALLRGHGPPGGATSNVVTLDRFGNPIDDQPSRQDQTYPSARQVGSGAHDRQDAAVARAFGVGR